MRAHPLVIVGRRFLGALLCRLRAVLATSERGALSLEWAWLSLAVIPLTFAGVQVAAWFQARDLCEAAAQSGVRAARVLDAPAGAGSAAAAAFARTVGGDSITDVRTEESLTPTTVSVTCHASALRVIPLPGIDFAVTQSASAGRERFTTPTSTSP